MSGVPLLTLLLACPILGLVGVLVTPARFPGAIKRIAAVSGLAAVGVVAVLWAKFDPGRPGYQFLELRSWVPAFGISWHNGVDGLNLPLLALTSIVYLTGVLVTWELRERVKEFFAFMMLLVVGVFGVFMTLDLFFFVFYYEVAVLPMYLLIAIWGSTRKEYGAMKLTLYLLVGTALVVPAALALYWGAGLGSFDLTRLAAAHYPRNFQLVVYPFLFVGFGILAGIWPLHTWSPVGHVAAPTAVSMLHAGVLMKLGAYGILRVAMPLLPEGAHYWATATAVLATVNIVYGAFVALAQTDLKFVIGYSSVSHMGIVLLGLSTLTEAGINGAVFQMFSHGIMTALFFASVGYIYDRLHTRDIGRLGGLSRSMPVASAFFIIAALTGAGVPGFSSFWAELLVFLGTLKTFPVLAVIVVAALTVTLAYSIRVIVLAFFGEPREARPHVADMGAFDSLPRAILVAFLLLFGFAPRLILDIIEPATRSLVRVLS
ncbi:MAG TPA: NADH-quinone oxidoreductase subunit M [Gemmatimonadales bacterium]|nr:NADH-quinone oxidoreductase subunit M [Gemmatimonadales bacterium]